MNFIREKCLFSTSFALPTNSSAKHIQKKKIDAYYNHVRVDSI